MAYYNTIKHVHLKKEVSCCFYYVFTIQYLVCSNSANDPCVVLACLVESVNE